MNVLVQVSDTHFGTERPEVAAALVGFVKGQRPDVVVLSGDVTQRARASQFRAAKEFCRSLDTHVLVIPGNHDIPLFNPLARLLWPYANYREAFGNELEPEFSSPGLLVICVNTTRPYRHKNGEISEPQLERVASRLRAASVDQLRVVVTHQPVHVVTIKDKANLLIGHERAVQVCADAGADVLMGGHIHLPYVRSLEGRVPGTSRRLWAVQAGTAVSRRVRGGVSNSVNVLRHTAGSSCHVERFDYGADGRFQRVARHELELDRRTEQPPRLDPRMTGARL